MTRGGQRLANALTATQIQWHNTVACLAAFKWLKTSLALLLTLSASE